jgi:alkanesulfonate monooxygenase SsuD/methylene tetrahydromethanopterin reductase-like flavin-dependent oxidoreductase (luciferase family)
MATSAERLGYDAVLVHDHVQWGDFDRYHFYAGSVEAVDALERATDFYEAHSVLAYLACKVPSLRLIPASIVLGWRDPTLVARLATTLYHLSEGRYVLSVCAGNVKKDFEVSGVPWEERGKRTEESLRIIRKLLREDGPQSHEGTFWHLEDVELFPKAPDLKIWYGGQSDAALRRTARFADGWLVGGSPDFYRQKVPTILRLAQEKYSRDLRLEVACLSPTSIAPTDAEAREVAEATVRKRQQEADWLKRTHDPRDIGGANLVGSPETIAARVREFADAGVSFIGMGFIGHSVDQIVDEMALFAEKVFPAVP